MAVCFNCGGHSGSFLILKDKRTVHEFVAECGALMGYNRHGSYCSCSFPEACSIDPDQTPIPRRPDFKARMGY